MNIQEIPILDLIPQRPPFVMVDRVVEFDWTRTTTSFLVRDDCLFVEDGMLISDGVVENVAQTCAARMGCISFIKGERVKLGFIGAVRNMSFSRQPVVGETLITSITVREEVFGMTMVDAEVRSGDEVIAKTEMKIALKD